MSYRNETQRIIVYQSWSRAKYLDLYDRLPWRVLTRNREATFGSIRNVHLHVLGAYTWWLVKMFHRKSLKPLFKTLDSKSFDRVTSAQQLRELDRRVDRELLEVGHTLTEARLRRRHNVGTARKKWMFTEREGLWHVLEEDYLHRGEILCMLWQDDIEPPYTGYMWWEYDTDPKSHPEQSWYRGKSDRLAGGYVKPRPKGRRR